MMAAAAVEVSWQTGPEQVILSSDWVTAPPSDFRVEIGSFATGFVPTASNSQDWEAHWSALDSVPLDHATGTFQGRTVLEGVLADHPVHGAFYLWGRSHGRVGSEEFLMGRTEWNWPDATDENQKDLAVTVDGQEGNDLLLGRLIEGDGRLLLQPRTGISYLNWIAAHFSPSERQDPLTIARTSDPDHDGLENLLEYAIGGNPTEAGENPQISLMAPSQESPRSEISLKIAAQAEIAWTVEMSENSLDPWAFQKVESVWQFGAKPNSGGTNLRVIPELAEGNRQSVFFRLGASDQAQFKNPLAEQITAYFNFDQLGSPSQDTLQGMIATEVGGEIASGIGQIGASRIFKGVEQRYLTVPETSRIFPAAGKTAGFSLWIEPQSILASGQAIMSIADGGEYDLLLYAQPDFLHLIVKRAFGGGTERVTIPYGLPLGAWTCVQGWYDSEGASLNLMVNGEHRAVRPAFQGMQPLQRSLNFGYGPLSSVQTRNYFNGRIDECYFWQGQKLLPELTEIARAGAEGLGFPFASNFRTFHSSAKYFWSGKGRQGVRFDLSGRQNHLYSQVPRVPNQNSWFFDGVDDQQESRIFELRAQQSLVLTFRRADAEDRGIVSFLQEDGTGFQLTLRSNRLCLDLELPGRDPVILQTDLLDSNLARPITCQVWHDGSKWALESHQTERVFSAPHGVGALTGKLILGQGALAGPGELSNFAGPIHEVRLFDRVVSRPELEDLHDLRYGVECWGDSLTTSFARGGGSGWTDLLSVLREGEAVNAHGFTGQPTSAILSHFESYRAYRERIHVIWVGNNSWPSGLQSEIEKIARMTMALPSRRYLVIGLPNRTRVDQSDEVIQAAANGITPINRRLAEIYGERFLDLQAEIIENYLPVSQEDVEDMARAIVPRSMRDFDFTGTHLSSAGAVFLANLVDERLNALGWGVE